MEFKKTTLQDCIDHNKERIETVKKSVAGKYEQPATWRELQIRSSENPYDEMYNIISQYYEIMLDNASVLTEKEKLRKEVLDLKAERMTLLEKNQNPGAQKVDVNTYSAMFKPCTQKGDKELENLKFGNEIVRTGEVYPNLFTQANYSIDEVNKVKNEIIDQVKSFFFSFGNSVSDSLLDSAYNNLQIRLEEEGENGFKKEQITKILNDTYTMTKAASMLNEISDSLGRMKRWSDRIELAKKGVLL